MASKQHCPHCDWVYDAEWLAVLRKHGPLVCPGCGRDGCPQCMPDGRGCLCPACEEGRDDA